MEDDLIRCLIITDSLGCPREQTHVENTWVDRIIKKWSGKNIFFYTYCHYGLSASDIDLCYIKRLRPDIIICQIGVVDARRRAFPLYITKYIQKFRNISRIYNWFARKYHYYLTKRHDIHYASINQYESCMREIARSAKMKYAFIKIAEPGRYLLEHTYNVKTDVTNYNKKIIHICKYVSGGVYLDPYGKYKSDYYLLEEDGLHLNSNGIELLVNTVDEFINHQI